MAVGFGEAGSEIISKNMEKGMYFADKVGM
jgi:hypothetical protein